MIFKIIKVLKEIKRKFSTIQDLERFWKLIWNVFLLTGGHTDDVDKHKMTSKYYQHDLIVLTATH